MTKEEQILKNHILDLARACYRRDIPQSSDFLNLSEQAFVHSFEKELPPVSVSWQGGYEMAERKRMEFSPLGAEFLNPAPLCIVRISPRSAKFAEELTHRDYLGALLNLGIDRSKVGDLLVSADGCQCICQPSVSDLIVSELARIRHTSVSCEIAGEATLSYEPKFREISASVASLRLDCVAAAAIHASRGTLGGLINGEKVYVNSRLCTSASVPVKEQDVISVRGYGKFRLQEVRNLTKKGRISVLIYFYE